MHTRDFTELSKSMGATVVMAAKEVVTAFQVLTSDAPLSSEEWSDGGALLRNTLPEVMTVRNLKHPIVTTMVFPYVLLQFVTHFELYFKDSELSECHFSSSSGSNARTGPTLECHDMEDLGACEFGKSLIGTK